MPTTSKRSTEFEVTTLTIDAIKDFRVCELFYECRHVKEEVEVIRPEKLLAERFDATIKKVASYLFYKKQTGTTIPSYNAILNRWEKLWFPSDMTAYDIATESTSVKGYSLISYSNLAAASLEYFHGLMEDDPGIPILIDEEFIVPVEKGLRILGSIDLILRHKDKYRVIKWHTGRRKPEVQSTLLDFALLKYAFDFRSEEPRDVEYMMYDLTSSRRGFISVDQPTSDDVDALRYWAKASANKEVYVPRRGYTSYCRGCPFDETCAAWNDWPV